MATAHRRSRKRRGEKREPRRNVCGASCGNVISRHVAIGEAFRLVPSLPRRTSSFNASRKCQAEGIVGTRRRRRRRPPSFSNPRSNTRFLVFLATLLWTLSFLSFYLSFFLFLSFKFFSFLPPSFFYWCVCSIHFLRGFARFLRGSLWVASILFYFNVFFFLFVCLIVWLIRVFFLSGMFGIVYLDCKSFFSESDE